MCTYIGLICLSLIFGDIKMFYYKIHKHTKRPVNNQSLMTNLLKIVFLWSHNYLLQLNKIITALFNFLSQLPN